MACREVAERGHQLAGVLTAYDVCLGGVGVGRWTRVVAADDLQVAQPGAAEVDDGGAQVGKARVRVAQRPGLPVQPHERLLRDVLGVVDTEQGGQPGHGTELPREQRGVVVDVGAVVAVHEVQCRWAHTLKTRSAPKG